MAGFTCPVCGKALGRDEKTYACENGHAFDTAKQGYVNLLLSNRSSDKRRGDDKRMIDARRSFLSAGHYAFLSDCVNALALSVLPDAPVILDAGCGEGYYTFRLKASLEAAGKSPDLLGIDISKDALIAFSRRGREIPTAAASVFHLPVETESVDFLLSVFAPDAPEEFLRVVKPGGYLCRVEPREDHLFSLKAAVYDRPYRNPAPAYAPAGFALVQREDLSRRLTLEGEALRDLFSMTPYCYKTSREDEEKLLSLPSLSLDASFAVFLLQKSDTDK